MYICKLINKPSYSNFTQDQLGIEHLNHLRNDFYLEKPTLT